MNQPQQPQGMGPSKPGVIAPWLLIVFIIVLVGGGGYLGWWYYQNHKTTTTTTPTTTTTTPTTTTSTTTTPSTTATTATPLTYTNDTYGFTLTFPATWKGYKMKEASITGATKTYYVNIPTKDAGAIGDTTAEVGYYSPFAISVYTLAEWTAVEASDGPKDTLITKGTQYAFGWSQANGVPPSDFTGGNDIKTIIASFKLK